MAYGLLSIGQTNPSFDRNGRAVTAEMRWYVNNTNTPATVYQDIEGNTPHDFPITSDANGIFPLVFGDEDTLYGMAWDTLEADPQSRRWNDINVATSANQSILTQTEAARDEAEEIADDLGDLETALETANTAAATATTQAGIATTQAGLAADSASDASDSAVLAEYWAGEAQAQAGGDFQPSDATLSALAALSTGADKLPYFTGTDTASQTTLTAAGRALLDDADAAAMRTTLGLAIGTDVQAYDAQLAALAALTSVANLEALAGLTSASNKLPYFTGAGTAAVADLTSAGRALLDDADAAAQRTTLGVVEASNSEAWTGSEAVKPMTPNRMFAAAASVSVSDSSTITLDGNAGFNFHVTLGGNRTLANPSNFKAGQSGRIRVTQDGTGSRTLSYGSRWDFPGGAPTLSTSASAVDVIAYYVHDASGSIEATLIKALS